MMCFMTQKKKGKIKEDQEGETCTLAVIKLKLEISPQLDPNSLGQINVEEYVISRRDWINFLKMIAGCTIFLRLLRTIVASTDLTIGQSN